MRVFWLSLCCLVLPFTARAQTKILNDFEQDSDLRVFEFKQKSAALSDQHATHGGKSLKIAGNEYVTSFRLPGVWSGFDSLDLDVFVEGEMPVSGSLLIADEAWQKSGGSYWNRHNGSFTLKPGANTVSIPVNGLFRGEAGSRNNDIKSNIDPSKIIRVDLGFKSKGDAALYLDHLRLTKESRPDGILAFDLGPESQAVFPGFTAIGPHTVYGKNGVKAGLRSAVGDRQARDDTFPTRLYQDFVAMDDNAFIADVADGRYGMWVMYDDLGYWGGEQAKYSWRTIDTPGAGVLYSENVAGHDGEYLYAFESIEPKPGDKLWDLYVKHLFRAREAVMNSRTGKVVLSFRANAGNSCNVAAIILYPMEKEVEAKQWIVGVEDRNRKEFENRAVFLGPKQAPLDVPESAKRKGWWTGFPSLEQDVTFCDPPGAAEGKLSRGAAKGQRISFTFAVRLLRSAPDLAVTLTASALKGPAGVIQAKEIDLRYVQHAVHRGFNDIAYTIGPESLRPVAGANLLLAKDLTRQFWVTVHVPELAAAGKYTGTVTLAAGDLKEELPIAVDVLDTHLDEPDFLMGFYGTDVPKEVLGQRGDDAWRELFRVLKENGMNSLSGGPGIRFSGFDAFGNPVLDFDACDHYFKLIKEAGFDKTINGYASLSVPIGLHDGYVIGEAGHAWEKKTGKPFGELLKIVWGAIAEHAKAAGWPHVQVNLTDEPRVLDQAKRQLELMTAYAQNVPFVDFGGSYSVKWNNDPFEQVVQGIFKILHWSGLNAHIQTDLDKAKEFGREILIYNQGTTRYSFGAYQWAEMRKGVRGRFQWHLLALHGYQYFDLDGREPDTAMINWGKDGTIPTIKLARCREGADDFRFAQTLWNLAEKHEGEKAADEAKAWLESISANIAVGQNERPRGFMEDEAFRNECAAKIRALLAK